MWIDFSLQARNKTKQIVYGNWYSIVLFYLFGLMKHIWVNRFGRRQRHYLHEGELYDLTHLPLVRIYASVNRVSNASDNGLSPIRRQAII